LADLHHPSRRQLLGLAGAVLLAGCSTTTVLAPIENGTSDDVTEKALAAVNAIRRRNGRAALAYDPVAANAARDQAIRMSRHGKMRHDLGSDASFYARMKRLGVAMPVAENIATGQDTIDAVLAAWVHSPKHLENMLGPYGGIGLAVARNSDTGNEPYWSMVLSNPPRSFGLRI
jgi:uncharacterized protein YkwD